MTPTTFQTCLAIEVEGYQLIRPYLDRHCEEYVYINTSKRKDLYNLIQKNAGDLIFKVNGEIYFADLKTEQSNRYGNFFLETWSNKSRNTPGWLDPKVGIQSDYLFYIFLEQKMMYSFNFPELRRWAYEQNNLKRFPEKCQKKYDQLNDTWGVCVPIEKLVREVKTRIVDLQKIEK